MFGRIPKVAEPTKPTRRPFGPLSQSPDLELGILHLRQDGLAPLQKPLARLRQGDRAAPPVEQDRTKILFQLLDLAAEWRLRHVQPLGGTPEVQFLGDGNEILQLLEVHPMPPSSPASR